MPRFKSTNQSGRANGKQQEDQDNSNEFSDNESSKNNEQKRSTRGGRRKQSHDERLYIVEKLLDRKGTGASREYLVKWQGNHFIIKKTALMDWTISKFNPSQQQRQRLNPSVQPANIFTLSFLILSHTNKKVEFVLIFYLLRGEKLEYFTILVRSQTLFAFLQTLLYCMHTRRERNWSIY